MTEKFVRKYMRFAKLVGEDQNPCYSRHIGAVIVNPDENRVVGTGYNGPPKKHPHTDSREFLDRIVWPQLTDCEKRTALKCVDLDESSKSTFLEVFTDCKTCPRRVVGAQSGTRLELCNCVHAEANAIINASESLRGCWMFAWCGIPCSECAKLIVNKQISTVVCLDRYCQGETKGGGNNYDASARIYLEWSGVQVIERDPDEMLRDLQ